MSNSLALSIIQCVFDMSGDYDRDSIAKILTGAVPENIRHIRMTQSVTYGAAKDTPVVEVLALMEWLVTENYLAYTVDTDYPVLIVTDRGLEVLAGD